MVDEMSDEEFAAREQLIAEAKRDGALFADEFPGETLDPAKTDWDGTAWEMVSQELRDVPGGWEIYQEALIAEIARLAAEARS